MTAAARQVAAEALPRPRPRALLLAAGTVWLPCLLPVVFGLLSDAGQAFSIYFLCAPIVPGGLVSMLLRLDGAAFFVAAALPTLLLFWGVYAAARAWPRPWLYVVQTLVIAQVAFAAVVFAMHANM